MAHDVFICYSSVDQHVADTVCEALESRDVRCWIAPRDVLPGQAWSGALVQAISESRVFILILSADSNRSPQVMREVSEAADKDIPIIPFRIDAVEPSNEIGYYLKPLHWLNAFPTPLEGHLIKLFEIVQALLAANGKSSTPSQPLMLVPSSTTVRKLPFPRWLWLVGTVVFVGLAVLGSSLIISLFSPVAATSIPPSVTQSPSQARTDSGTLAVGALPTFPISATRVIYEDIGLNFTLKYPSDWEVVEKSPDLVKFRYNIFSYINFYVKNVPMPGKVGDESTINNIYQAAQYSAKINKMEITLVRKGFWTGPPFIPANYVEVNQAGQYNYIWIHAPLDGQHYAIVAGFKPEFWDIYSQSELEVITQMVTSIKMK